MSAKRKHRSTNEYLKYLKGELSREERYSFERELEADPFEKEALEGMELSAAGEVEEDLLSLHDTLGKRLKRRRRRTYYSIAASVASFLIVGTIFINLHEFNPRSDGESTPKDESFFQEESAMQPAAQVADEEQDDIPGEDQKSVASKKAAPVRDADGEVSLVKVDAIAYEERVLEGAQTPDEVVAMEAAPQQSREAGRKKEMKNAAPAPEAVPEPVTSERLSGVVKASDSDMVSDIATLDEVVVLGYDVEREAYATGAAQKVQPDKEEITYSGAEPEGGIEAFKMYMEETIRFPAGDTISKRELVVLKFVVEADGTISDISTLRSPGDAFSEVAIRLLMEGPSWKPARDKSGTTDDVVRMRIVFKR